MTGIEWTDEPPERDKSTRLEASSDIAGDVVPRYEATRTSVAVEQRERSAAAAFARDVRVRLAEPPQIGTRAVLSAVRPTGQHLKVLGSVVELVVVPMVDNLTAPERASEHLRCDEAVLVDVSPRVGHWVTNSLHQDVAVAGDRPAALPVAVLRSRPRTGHRYSVASGMEQH